MTSWVGKKNFYNYGLYLTPSFRFNPGDLDYCEKRSKGDNF